jgi:hypothetical protein
VKRGFRGHRHVYPRTINKILEALKAKLEGGGRYPINYTPFGH